MFFKVIFHFLQCFPEDFFIEEHAFQIQSRSGGCFGHKLPVTGGQYLRCPGAVPSALADFEYVRNEYPYHVVQETGTDDDDLVCRLLLEKKNGSIKQKDGKEFEKTRATKAQKETGDENVPLVRE